MRSIFEHGLSGMKLNCDLGESFGSIDLGGSTEVIAVATFAVFAKVSDMAPDFINGPVSPPKLSLIWLQLLCFT